MKSRIYIIVCLLLTACQPSEYKEISNEVKKKLILFGEGNTPVSKAKYVDVSFNVSALNDGEVILKSNEVFLSDFHSSIFGKENLSKDLENLKSGDSVQYVLSYLTIKDQILDEFINSEVILHDSTTVTVGLKCNFSMTEEEYVEYREKLVREGVAEEMELINEYIERENIGDRLTKKGDLFYMKTKKMSTGTVRITDDVAVAYSCSFLNGKVFNSVPFDKPQILNMSSPDQLIKGIESVLKEMSEGEMSRVIIPSYLAFGEHGSSDGSVPPKTPIIADIHLVEIFN